jgi:GNAT superfamily N-acetyltransferase
MRLKNSLRGSYIDRGQVKDQRHTHDGKRGIPNRTWLSPQYIHIRGRQLEGTFNSDPTIGCWLISGLRVLRGWGAPYEEQWPYVGDIKSWPPKEPSWIDEYAKENKIFAYQRVSSANECKLTLAAGRSVSIAVEITKSWFNAKMGEIQLPKASDKIIGGHCVFLFGYDDRRRVFEFQNSWGKEWGNNGRGYLPYRYVDRLLTEGWVIIPHRDVLLTEKYQGSIERYWAIPTVLHGVLHGIEIRDSQSNDRKSWGFALQYDNYLNVEEFFVRPTYRGKGYSRILCDHFDKLSSHLCIPLRFWISHADNNRSNMAIVRHMADVHGFTLYNSSVRWAAFKIEKRGIPIQKSSHTAPQAAHRPLRSSIFKYFSD